MRKAEAKFEHRSRQRHRRKSADGNSVSTASREVASNRKGLRERKRIERRSEILESAAAIFRRKSFDDTRIEEIAVEADVSPGTVYNYFPTKDALLLALTDHYRAGIPAAVAKFLEKPQAAPLNAFMQFYTTVIRESTRYLDKPLWRHVHAATMVSGWHQHGSERWRHEENLIDFQCRLVQTLQSLGTIPTDVPIRPLAEIIHACAFFWWQRYIAQDDMSRPDLLASLKKDLRFVLGQVCRPSKSSPGARGKV